MIRKQAAGMKLYIAIMHQPALAIVSSNAIINKAFCSTSTRFNL